MPWPEESVGRAAGDYRCDLASGQSFQPTSQSWKDSCEYAVKAELKRIGDWRHQNELAFLREGDVSGFYTGGSIWDRRPQPCRRCGFVSCGSDFLDSIGFVDPTPDRITVPRQAERTPTPAWYTVHIDFKGTCDRSYLTNLRSSVCLDQSGTMTVFKNKRFM